jgi:hypothetical protein
MVRKIVHLRRTQCLGPVKIAARVGCGPSTAHRMLVRCRISRLAHVDRATGEPVRYYEHSTPVDLRHVDVREVGRTSLTARAGGSSAVSGASSTAPPPQTSRATPTAAEARRRARARRARWPPEGGQVLDPQRRDRRHRARGPARRGGLDHLPRREDLAGGVGQGSAYRSHLCRDTCAQLAITPPLPAASQRQDRTAPLRHERWLGLPPPYLNESRRRKALFGWIHKYNHHRPHTAIGGHRPTARLTNLSGQYI